MKKHHVKKIKQGSKITLLLIFTLITVGSNPRTASLTVVNENSNLSKMVDVEQIGSARRIETVKISELVEEAKEIKINTDAAMAKLDINMDLSQPSGFTLNQFKLALVNSKYIKNDKHDVIMNNIEAFYNAEQKYGINGIFLLSIAVHESGWGTSSLAINHNNLFGYVGMSFDSYESCIDYVAKTLMQRYLNPAGEEIKGLEGTATGIYYSGSTIADVHKIYATGPTWTTKIFSYMSHFYENIIR